MSLITTCPACGTAFHVEPAQLAVHRGDVGCGKCGHVFNALERLSEIEPELPTPEPASAVAPEPRPPVELELQSGADALAQAMPLSDAVATPPEAESPPAPVPLAPAMQAPVEEAAPLPVRLPPAAEAAMPGARSLPEPELTAPSRSPRRRVSRWLLPPLALLLLLSAAMQGAYFLRAQLAAQLPQTRPMLVRACDLLGCRIELPQQAELLNIDDSDLRKDEEHDNVYFLSASLTNRARYAQGYPLLELTLTDLDDQPLLRRTLTPQEYLPAPADIAAGFAPGGELHVKLAFALDGLSATGYRVYVTYP